MLVDTDGNDLVRFKTLMPAASRMRPGEATRPCSMRLARRLRRLGLPQAGLGAHVWDGLPARTLDRMSVDTASIDGVIGVLALGCQRVRFDFEKREFGWSR